MNCDIREKIDWRDVKTGLVIGLGYAILVTLNLMMPEWPASHFVLRRGSLRLQLRSKRRLVDLRGIEPLTSALRMRFQGVS